MNFNHSHIDYSQGFNYDAINRLVSSSFIDHSNYGINIYNEDLHYDSHGNITTLQRTGLTPLSLIDDLSANYWPQTNRLKTVSDAQTSTAGFHDAHKAPSVNVSNSGSMQLIISQVHYNSEHQSPQNAAEFIEVMNISTQPVNLKNWVLDDVSHAQQSYRVLNDFWLQPDQRAVFANDWEGLYTEHYRYGYDFDLNDNTGQGQNAQGQNILRIRLADNGDDAIALRRPDGSIEDYMSWRGTSYGGYTWNLTQNGDKTMSLHRQHVNCSTGCSKPGDWTVGPRAPYVADYYYDANGNRIIDKDSGMAMMNGDARGMHFTSHERNLPIRIGEARYRYNAEGHRYYSEVGGVATVTIMDGDRNVGTFQGVNGTNWQLSYWNIHGNGLEGRYDNPNVVFHKRYYHKDHLGSTRVVVNQDGTVIGSYDYYPFGLEMPGRSFTAGSATREKFTGHQRDEEVGLDYMVWRRYNPAFPVFLSVDPLYALYPGWSPYAYVMNNPLRFIDPTGMCAEHIIANAEEGTYEGAEALALFAQHCETDDTSDNNSDSFTMQDIDEINSMLLAASFSTSALENFWTRFSSLNADDLIRLRGTLERSLPKNRVDEIMNKHARYIHFAKSVGYKIVFIDAIIRYNDVSNNPAFLNTTVNVGEFGVGAYAAYGGPYGVAIAIIYFGGKYYMIHADRAIHQGTLKRRQLWTYPAPYIPGGW